MVRNIENITITFEKDLLEWVDGQRGRVQRSPFVRDIIREKMNQEIARS